MIYIVAQVRPIEEINPETISTDSPEEGVFIVTGTLTDSDQSVISSVNFDPAKFDEIKAKEWLDNNDIVSSDLEEVELEEFMVDPDEQEEPAPEEDKEEMSKDLEEKEEVDEEEDKASFDLDGVEIMRVGTWNDTTFTKGDLDDMVSAFTETRKELKPFLKLGHDDDQALLQSDGMPSAGWITELKRSGDSLIADIKNIPKKIYNLIKNKRYGRFSAEVYFDAKIGERPFRRALKAVALLGADTPAVSSMQDLIGLYSKKDKAIIKYSQIVTTDEGDNMSKEFSEKLEAVMDENKRLRADLDRSNEDRQREKVNAYIQKAVEEGKILPAQTQLYSALMMDNQVRNFSMIDGGKLKVKEFSSFDIVSQILDGSKPQVDFSERSLNYKPESVNDDDALHEKIEAYSKDNNISYSEAFDLVTKEAK